MLVEFIYEPTQVFVVLHFLNIHDIQDTDNKIVNVNDLSARAVLGLNARTLELFHRFTKMLRMIVIIFNLLVTMAAAQDSPVQLPKGVPGFPGVLDVCQTDTSACFSIIKVKIPGGDVMVIRPNEYCPTTDSSCIANLYAKRSGRETLDWILFKSPKYHTVCIAFNDDPQDKSSIPWICNEKRSLPHSTMNAKAFIGVYNDLENVMHEAFGADGKTYTNQYGIDEYEDPVIDNNGIVYLSYDEHFDFATTRKFDVYQDPIYIHVYVNKGTTSGKTQVSEQVYLFDVPRRVEPTTTTPAPMTTSHEAPNPESSDVNWGLIVIIIFSIVLAILTAVLIGLFIRYKRKKAVMNAKGFTPDDPEYHNFSIKEFPSTVGSTISETPDRMTTGSTIGKTTIRTIDDSGIASNKTIK